MPLYEYKCTACGKHTEKRQKFSDPEITECPFCGGKLERVLSAPAIAFKGGGWYKDGYGNAKPAASRGSDAAPAGGGESGAEKPSTPAATEGSAASAPAPAAPAAVPAAASTSEKK